MTNTTQFEVTIKSTESGEVVLNEVYPSARVADKEMKAFLISQTDPADTESIRAIGETVRFTEYGWWGKDNHTKHLHCPFEVMMVPVLENAHYYISTFFVKTELKKFKNDADAWNNLAKELDSCYKTGRSVIGYLYKITRVTEIHRPMPYSSCDWSIGVPVCVGFTSRDYDGKSWNNPILCAKCREPMTPDRGRFELCCEQCQQKLDQGDKFHDGSN
jgi:hypothetical protein